MIVKRVQKATFLALFGSLLEVFFDVFVDEFFDVVFGRFFAQFGSIWGSFGDPFGTLGSPLGPLLAPNGSSWGVLGALWGFIGALWGVTWPLKGRLGGPGRLFAPKWSQNGATCVQNVRKLVCISGKFAALASSSAISLQPFVYTVGPGGLRGAIRIIRSAPSL